MVGLERAGRFVESAAPSMEELALLAETAGAAVLEKVVQRREAPDPACYIGKGKAQELARMVEEKGAELIVFNEELSPSQLRNLDRIMEVRIVDRTALILDIFARRARSREGKLQVELAQLQYVLPRLTGLGPQLSRLGGGIGTRGPGETQLEVDRRTIRRRIRDLKREISSLRRHRTLHRSERQRKRYPVVALVGYTNAGKSTLLNALTGADLYTEDKLFATLDPSVRRGRLGDGRIALFTDTVGLIKHLPQQLVTAFQATLEEITAADILLHVVDISHPQYLSQIEIVRQHLERLDEEFYRKELLVFNKIDSLESFSREEAYLKREHPGASFVSARRGDGLEALKETLVQAIDRFSVRVRAYLPYQQGELLEQIRRFGSMIKLDYHPGYVEVEAQVDSALSRQLAPYHRPPGEKRAGRPPGEREAGDG